MAFPNHRNSFIRVSTPYLGTARDVFCSELPVTCDDFRVGLKQIGLFSADPSCEYWPRAC